MSFKKHCMSFQKNIDEAGLEAEQGNGGQSYGDACHLAASGQLAQHQRGEQNGAAG